VIENEVMMKVTNFFSTPYRW